METRKILCSRAYWEKYIDATIDSIKEDKDTIIDMLIYGNCINAKITMNLCQDCLPTYSVHINKSCDKSPFDE